jgi:hypothetical protein
MACIANPQLWVYVIFLVAGIMIIRLVIPAALAFFGLGGIAAQVVMIILWACIAAAGVYLMAELFQCAFSGGFPSLNLPRGR